MSIKPHQTCTLLFCAGVFGFTRILELKNNRTLKPQRVSNSLPRSDDVALIFIGKKNTKSDGLSFKIASQSEKFTLRLSVYIVANRKYKLIAKHTFCAAKQTEQQHPTETSFSDLKCSKRKSARFRGALLWTCVRSVLFRWVGAAAPRRSSHVKHFNQIYPSVLYSRLVYINQRRAVDVPLNALKVLNNRNATLTMARTERVVWREYRTILRKYACESPPGV